MGQFSSGAASSRSSTGTQSTAGSGASVTPASTGAATSRPYQPSSTSSSPYSSAQLCSARSSRIALYAGSSSYDPYYALYADPYGGYLRGSADVINSQSRLMTDQQQSALTAEYVAQARMETRGHQFDQWLYERANRPTLEDDRERVQQKELQRSRNDPPLAEIHSGKALNDLLVEVQKLHGKGIRGAQLDIDEEVIQHINLTPGEGGGHVGLLKSADGLDWPDALRIHVAKERRDRVGELIEKATKEAKAGKQASVALQEMDRSLQKLQQNLRDVINDLPPSQYIEAKRFLWNMDAALRALQRPDAAQYFSGRYAAQGNSVARLVEHMTKQGLRFAPAVAGDEPAYVALHRALVAYESQAQSVLLAEK